DPPGHLDCDEFFMLTPPMNSSSRTSRKERALSPSAPVGRRDLRHSLRQHRVTSQILLDSPLPRFCSSKNSVTGPPLPTQSNIFHQPIVTIAESLRVVQVVSGIVIHHRLGFACGAARADRSV